MFTYSLALISVPRNGVDSYSIGLNKMVHGIQRSGPPCFEQWFWETSICLYIQNLWLRKLEGLLVNLGNMIQFHLFMSPSGGCLWNQQVLIYCSLNMHNDWATMWGWWWGQGRVWGPGTNNQETQAGASLRSLPGLRTACSKWLVTASTCMSRHCSKCLTRLTQLSH